MALVRCGGLASGKQLAAEATAAASVELYGVAPDTAANQRSGAADSEGSRSHKKARVTPQPGPPAEDAATGPGGGSPEQLASQAAALQLLAAVVEGAGPALPPTLRARLDAMAVHVAACAAQAATALSRDPAAPHLTVTAVTGLALQSLRLLLASVLSPLSHRPPFLSQVGVLIAECAVTGLQ